MTIKYTNILQSKVIQKLPKLGFLVWKQSGNPDVDVPANLQQIQKLWIQIWKEGFMYIFSPKLGRCFGSDEEWYENQN
jgi:hypothetical protein